MRGVGPVYHALVKAVAIGRIPLHREYATIRPMDAASREIVEVEWQFEARDLGAVAEWLSKANVPGYSLRAGKTKQQRDTYWDTADGAISRARFTCRVRERGDGAEATMKGTAEARGGMRTRREVTAELPPGATSPAGAPGECGHLVRVLCGKQPLVELFTLTQKRQIFLLSDDQGELAEISLDQSRAERGGLGGEMVRVEVEVEEGAEERARRFVDLLVAMGGLTPAETSKFQAAMALTGQEPTPKSPALGSTALSPSMTAAEAAYAVLRKHFGVFLANEPSTRLGEDIEGLHDMRVAARRLRAAMSAFRPYLPPRFDRFRLELGWVAAALGVVRDLDVQIERMEEWRAGFDESHAHALDGIEQILEHRRGRGRARMLAVLDSRRYALFVERFSAALRIGPPHGFEAGAVPALDAGPRLIERRYRRVRKLGDAITPASPAYEYHTLRIDAKKLRYALEFFGPLYGKQSLDFSSRVTALQDVLGLHQDAEVAVDMLRDLAESDGRRLGPSTLMAMGAISERYRQHGAELRGQFPAVYGPLKGKEWKALRALMEERMGGRGNVN